MNLLQQAARSLLVPACPFPAAHQHCSGAFAGVSACVQSGAQRLMSAAPGAAAQMALIKALRERSSAPITDVKVSLAAAGDSSVGGSARPDVVEHAIGPQGARL